MMGHEVFNLHISIFIISLFGNHPRFGEKSLTRFTSNSDKNLTKEIFIDTLYDAIKR